MLPYFEHPSWDLGPLTVYAFGIAVAAAIWFGLVMAQRRFERSGLDARIGNRLGIWVLGGGLLGAHLFSVVLYFPHQLASDPGLLLRFWENISSFGSIIGGVTGGLLFFYVKQPLTGWPRKLAYFDAIALVFPGALAIGRLGCALAHDHPGTVTNFPLAISLESEAAQGYIGRVYAAAGAPLPHDLASLGFHDLGLYEFLFLLLVVVPAIAHWSRQSRPPGFYIVAFAALYLPVRFGLDMLRVTDVRYVGLTPAQWVAAMALVALPFVAIRKRRLRLAVACLVIVVTAYACWAG